MKKPVENTIGFYNSSILKRIIRLIQNIDLTVDFVEQFLL